MIKLTLFNIFWLLNLGSNPQAPDNAVQKAVEAASPQTDKPSAREVITKVQGFYEETSTLTAKFRQVYENKTFGKKSTSDGYVYIKKPGKMKWNYYERKRKDRSIVSDGNELWVVEHDNKQAFKKKLEDNLLPVAVTFLYGKGNLLEDFDAEFDRKPWIKRRRGEYLIKLTPKQPSAQYKTLWLVVAPDNYRVRRSIVLEASGNTNAFTFYEPKLGKAIADAQFVVDERALRSMKFRIVEADEQPAQ